MKVLRIEPVPGTRLAENKQDAKRLREDVLLPALATGERVQLDFSQVEFATQSFVHALISKAIRRYREDAFDLITFAHCTDEIRQTVLTVFEYTFAAAEAAEVHSRSSPERGYRGSTVVKLVGISYRQLDYWARTGLVVPSIRAAGRLGSQRLYSFDDIVELSIIKRLLDLGLSLQHIRAAISYLRRQFPAGTLAGAGEISLFSDGRRIYAGPPDEVITDLLSNKQTGFVISVDAVRTDLKAAVADLPLHERAEGVHPSSEDEPS